MKVVALEVLYPTHFSLVYGGEDDDSDGGAKLGAEHKDEGAAHGGGHGHAAAAAPAGASEGHEDHLDHSLHTPLEV
jgi:hypothetical protein